MRWTILDAWARPMYGNAMQRLAVALHIAGTTNRCLACSTRSSCRQSRPISSTLPRRKTAALSTKWTTCRASPQERLNCSCPVVRTRTTRLRHGCTHTHTHTHTHKHTHTHTHGSLHDWQACWRSVPAGSRAPASRCAWPRGWPRRAMRCGLSHPPALVAAPSLGSRTRCRSVQSRLCASLLVHACAQARVCVIACVRERA